MSVGPDFATANPSLSGNDGELVSVRVSVDPRHLEKLLEVLAQVSFPINPEIYHQAGIGYVYPDGREEVVSATMVEFPVFSHRLPEVRDVLKTSSLPPGAAHVQSMLENIHSNHDAEAAPDGAPYRQVNFYRRLPGT